MARFCAPSISTRASSEAMPSCWARVGVRSNERLQAAARGHQETVQPEHDDGADNRHDEPGRIALAIQPHGTAQPTTEPGLRQQARSPLTPCRLTAYVANVFVLAEHRYAGVGTALHEAADADLAAMGLRARAFADTLDWEPIAAATAELYWGA